MNEEVKEIKNVNNLLELKNLLLEAKINGELVKNIIVDEGSVVGLDLESQGEIKIENNLVVEFETNLDEWYVSFLFNDSSSLGMAFLGSEVGININVNLNPFNSAPLAAQASIETPLNGMFRIRIVGQDGEFSDIVTSTTEVKTKHELDILGLYAGFENIVEFTFLSPKGDERLTVVRMINTDSLPDGFPEFEIVRQYETEEKNVVFLVNFRPTGIPFMVDRFGKIRWYSTGFSEGAKYALQRFKNGNMGFGKGGNGQGSIFEYSITGELIKEYSFYPEFENAHHDVYEMSNGNFIVPVNKVGEPTVEDYVIELDRNSGATTNVWDLNLILPKRDTLWNNPVDWVHVNAVIHDERDNSIIVSGQRQGLFKVSWDNQLIWIMAPPYDWEGYEDYLLTSSDENMEWNWGQHAPLITPKGNLLFFDNGFGRGFGTSAKFSRAVEMQIDENEIGGTVKTIWEYGKDRGEAFYSPIISDVDYLEESDTRLIIAGSLGFNHEYIDKDNINNSWSNDFLRSKIVEVDANQNVLFELNINSDITNNGVPNSSVYRAEKLKLY
ncbi:MAG: aryl-sulfate sulfotransferase [Bacteroidota bacterium]